MQIQREVLTKIREKLKKHLLQDLNLSPLQTEELLTMYQEEEVEPYKFYDPNNGTLWILYSPKRSTIYSFLFENTQDMLNLLSDALDELILKESLIGVEILEEESHKIIDLLIRYGFRPFLRKRKNDLKFVRFELSTAIYFDRIKGKEIKPKGKYQKEKVVIKKLPSITYDQIKETLREIFILLGGIDKYVQKGMTVVLKPNVVADHGMRNGKYVGGVVTDKRILKALIELLLPLAKRIIVAEGSSINRKETFKLFELYNYFELVEIDPKKVSLCDLNTDDTEEIPVPYAKRLEARKVPKTLLEADVIINLPVMKTHFAAVVSLGVKNLQGCMPPLEKYMTHFFGLWQNLVNIHHLVKPKLTIVDALVAQEGFGPVYGEPKEMGLLIAGDNPVAVDAVCMRIMGLKPTDSPAVYLAYIQGIGPIEEENIEVVGNSIEEVRSPFLLPEINLSNGPHFKIFAEGACPGCKGYLHFVIQKLRRPDPKNPERQLIERPFDPEVNVFIGPYENGKISKKKKNIFIGLCQSHNASKGELVMGCPPHAEAIMNAVFKLFPDVPRPTYADESEEAKLEGMLKEILQKFQLT